MEDATFPAQWERLLQSTNSKTDASLATALGISAQSVSQARAKEKIPAQWFIDISVKYGVSADWVLYGIGSRQLGSPTASPAPHRRSTDRVVSAHRPETINCADTEIVLIPMVEAVLSAGHGSFEVSEESERRYAFRADFLRRKGNSAEMVLMRVDGDSMEPRICDGDVVLIDQSQKALRPGMIYAVGVEDMVFLKAVSAQPGRVILHSFNEAYPPLEVDTREQMEDSVRIVGRCVWSCREL